MVKSSVPGKVDMDNTVSLIRHGKGFPQVIFQVDV
jgi:hypothetical protein